MRAAMWRIALILLLYILLTDAPHYGQEPPMQPALIPLTVQPLPRPDPAVQRAYGPLRLEGLWRLHSPAGAFGGISSLTAWGSGRFTGLNDSGEHVEFSLSDHRAPMAALPRLLSQLVEHRYQQDTESMTRDPATGRIWVGFESVQRICRYSRGFEVIERCGTTPALQAWPIQGSIESLARLGDGRFIALGERANAPGGGYDALLWSGDPTEPATPAPVHLSYRGPTGFRPTDALWLGGDKLLVLNRRLTVAGWFTARLTLVRLPHLHEGAVLDGEVIASFEPPGPVDNMEALALSMEGGRPVLWIASDDNHLFLQKSLLFKFALPPDWVSDRPAP